MDLFGPTTYTSIGGNKYGFVLTRNVEFGICDEGLGKFGTWTLYAIC
jgi:hypothetical protein